MRFFVFFAVFFFSSVVSGQNDKIDKGDLILKSGYTLLVPQFDQNSQLGMSRYGMPTLSVGCLLSENFSLEFFAGVPSTISVFSSASGGETKVASFVPLSPNMVLQYYFRPKSSAFRPYVGAGLIYSSFHRVKPLGPLTGATFSLKNSLDPVFQVGVDYPLNDKISVNVDIKKLKTSSGASATNLDKTALGPYAPKSIDYQMGMEPLAISLNVVWLFEDLKTRKKNNRPRARARHNKRSQRSLLF